MGTRDCRETRNRPEDELEGSFVGGMKAVQSEKCQTKNKSKRERARARAKLCQARERHPSKYHGQTHSLALGQSRRRENAKLQRK